MNECLKSWTLYAVSVVVLTRRQVLPANKRVPSAAWREKKTPLQIRLDFANIMTVKETAYRTLSLIFLPSKGNHASLRNDRNYT